MKLGLRSGLIKPYLDKLQTIEDNTKVLDEKVHPTLLGYENTLKF